MKKPSYVHCLFEQSGTFRDAFLSLGIPSADYDISNTFGKTDRLVDLFHEIKLADSGRSSVFDVFSPDDLLFAFFPCIYFSNQSNLNLLVGCHDYKNVPVIERFRRISDLQRLRSRNLVTFVRMFSVCEKKGLRLIVENPWGSCSPLRNFLFPPSIVEYNRSLRGDLRIKPTAYWFYNCKPFRGYTFCKVPRSRVMTHKQLKPSDTPGTCSLPRSMISDRYARNFICDHILGVPSGVSPSQLDLFDS